MDRGAWQATIHGVSKNQRWLSTTIQQYNLPCTHSGAKCKHSCFLAALFVNSQKVGNDPNVHQPRSGQRNPEERGVAGNAIQPRKGATL